MDVNYNHQGKLCTRPQHTVAGWLISTQHPRVKDSLWKVNNLKSMSGHYEVKNLDSLGEDQSQNKVQSLFTLVLLPNLKDTASSLHLPCWWKQTLLYTWSSVVEQIGPRLNCCAASMITDQQQVILLTFLLTYINQIKVYGVGSNCNGNPWIM